MRAQALKTLQDFGRLPSDQIAWLAPHNSSKRCIRARDFQLETVEKVISKTDGYFELWLFLGSGNDFPERPLSLGRRAWEAVQMEYLNFQERDLLVDLGWRTLELNTDAASCQD